MPVKLQKEYNFINYRTTLRFEKFLCVTTQLNNNIILYKATMQLASVCSETQTEPNCDKVCDEVCDKLSISKTVCESLLSTCDNFTGGDSVKNTLNNTS